MAGSIGVLRKDQLGALKEWMLGEGIEFRPGKGEWQMVQIRIGTKWVPIFDTGKSKVYLSVPKDAIRLVINFSKDKHD